MAFGILNLIDNLRNDLLKKNNETIREKYASKETFKSAAFRMFLTKKIECLITIFSTETAFFCSQFLDQCQIENLNLLVNKKA